MACRIGISTRSIRFYEAIGLLPEPARTASGWAAHRPVARHRGVPVQGCSEEHNDMLTPKQGSAPATLVPGDAIGPN
jgi:hypothetical protein